MNIIINNKAKAPKKYLRFIKWRIFKIKRKLDNLRSIDFYINRDGDHLFTIRSNISTSNGRIYLMERENNLKLGLSKHLKSIERHLRKNKEKTLMGN